MSKVDQTAQTVTIDADGLVRVDGVTVFRRVLRGDELFVQFQDGDRMRRQRRGTRYVEVSWDALTATLIKSLRA